MANSRKKTKKTVQNTRNKAEEPDLKTAGRSLKGWLTGIAVLLIAGGTAFTFIPEEKVPEALEPIHTELLAARNTIIAKTRLDISRFDDTAVVDVPGSSPVKLYFAPSPNIKRGLCDLIRSAKSTVDICIYDLDLNEVAEALLDAKARKVEVRLVTDEDNVMMAAVEKLKSAGVTVVPDNRPAIMHNKFVVVDARYIWTGSYNFTVNGTTRNDNNALILESPEIAACYLTKFNEYIEGRFGPKASHKTFRGRVVIGRMPVIVAFSPSDGVRNIILDELSNAKNSVKLMAFSFTDQEIANLLGTLAKKGVSVKCLFDYGQANSKYSQDSYLRGCGVKIKLSPNRSGKMHHKVIIIDEETVITGSYNYSKNAERNNDENILILKNREIAAKYIKEFKRCWKGTKGYL